MRSKGAGHVGGRHDDESGCAPVRLNEHLDVPALVVQYPCPGLTRLPDLSRRFHGLLVELGAPQRAVDRPAGFDRHVHPHAARRIALDDLDGPHLDPVACRCLAVTRRIARLAVPRRMRAGHPTQQLDRVRQHRQDRVERLANALRAPREVEHQRPADRSGDGPREGRHRRLREPGGTHHLGETGRLPIDHRARRLRRHVARAEPRPAGRHDERVGPGELSEDRFDPSTIVGDHCPAAHVEPGLAKDPLGDIPGLVGARAVADAVRDREHGCDRSIDHEHILASVSRFARAQAVGTRANASSTTSTNRGACRRLFFRLNVSPTVTSAP